MEDISLKPDSKGASVKSRGRKNHGLHFTLVPDISINEGIDAVRNMLNRCWFDEVKCAKGVTALKSYKKQWNDRHGC